MTFAAAEVLPRYAQGQANAPRINLKLRSGPPLARVPSDFVGLGYEMSSAARLGLISVRNTPYLRLIRNLGKEGVLRFGGIVADFARYDAEGQNIAEPKNTVLTRTNLEQLRAFLNATGWKAIWSVNFGNGTLEAAIAQMRDVVAIFGDRLYAVELGNEVENYGRGAHPRRPAPYNFAKYWAEYKAWHAALTAAVPGLRFAAPDTAASVDWVEKMAEDAKGEVQLLTTHYYRNGQLQGSPEQLATPDPGLRARLERLQAASRQSGIPWRMCETNSFSGGGRPGVSDTLLGALWTLDYMLLLASYGCAGVNLETGVNQLGFVSSYSPIQDDEAGHNFAGAPYYGMLACSTAMRGAPEVLGLEMDCNPGGLTAYVLGESGRPYSLGVINRSESSDAQIVFRGLRMGKVQIMRLSGPSALARAGITFAGASVQQSGTWRPRSAAATEEQHVFVPRMSAVVLMQDKR